MSRPIERYFSFLGDDSGKLDESRISRTILDSVLSVLVVDRC